MTRKKAPRRTGFWSEPIPLLTKVYQCGKERLNEVEWLFQSFPAPYRSLLDPDSKPPPNQVGPFTPHQIQILEEVFIMCQMAQSTMQTIYEMQGILPEVLEYLNSFLETRRDRLVYKPGLYYQRIALVPLYDEKPERPLFVKKERLRQQRKQEAEAKYAAFGDTAALRSQHMEIVEKGLVPVNDIEEIEERKETTAAGVIALELKRLLLEDSHLLSRCEECQSIFERSRAGQRFCSERCGSRSRKRRLRSQEKEKKTV